MRSVKTAKKYPIINSIGLAENTSKTFPCTFAPLLLGWHKKSETSSNHLGTEQANSIKIFYFCCENSYN